MTKPTCAPLYVIGLGPGDAAYLAPEAKARLVECQTICGYDAYIELVDSALLAGKEIISTGMKKEVDRALLALESARSGKTTALVCSGDPGIYALAGLVLELVEQQGLSAMEFPLSIIPGIPAVCAAAALLGAPLTHDFAVISLSDLLTPLETILHRLQCAFDGDFVVALYNPRSKKRGEYLRNALDIALAYRNNNTPVGIVRNAFRPGQSVTIAALADVDVTMVDMFTLVLIGNSNTRIVSGPGECPLAWEYGARMLTPRGYMRKYAQKMTR